jgi:carbonic anhydrase
MTNTIEKILDLHKNLPTSDNDVVPDHNPEILLIGCIDARLDVFTDIGLPRGKALIMRNIAALIAGIKEDGRSRSTEAAALQFAITAKQVKHIVVMGHTHCGGIEACVHGLDLPEVQRYLAPLEPARDKVRASGGSLDDQARTMEEEAVRQSVKNLMTFPCVEKAVSEGLIQVHGWVIDIATKRLKVMNENGEFAFI